MSRTILTATDLASEMLAGGEALDTTARASSSSTKKPDIYVDRLLKLVPAEVVAVWVTLRSSLSGSGTPLWLEWATFILLLVLTPLYLRRGAKVTNSRQILVSTGAFAVWCYSLGGVPFHTLPDNFILPVYGAVLLPLYTFAAPLLVD